MTIAFRQYLTAAVALLAGALAPAAAAQIPCLSGFVRDSGGGPVVAGDLDFFDSTTGVKLNTPGDNTDGFGFYNVCVLQGIYDVTFAPPPGTRLLGKRFNGIDLRSGGMLLDVVLGTGLVLSGRVTDVTVGTPVVGVDVDVDRVNGNRIFTPDDKTNLAGDYRVVVPAGLYRVRFDPPPGGRLRGIQIDSVSIAGDTIVDMTLPQGVLLSGRVRDALGVDLQSVEVDLRDANKGTKIFVSNNETDVGGNYSVAVPTGLFRLRFIPPLGSPFVAAAIDSFAIAGDARQDMILQPGHLVRVVARDTTGAPIAGVDVDAKLALTREKIFTPHDKTDVAGRTTIVLASNTYDLQFDPPLGTTLDRTVIDGMMITSDTTVTVTLREVARVLATGRVVDELGSGVPTVEIGARVAGSSASVFVPSPLTDANGLFALSIPIGLLDITLSPAPNVRLVGRRISAVTVEADSIWGDLVLRAGSFLTVRVSDEFGQPVRRADLDIIDEATSSGVFVPRDETGSDGVAVVVLSSGSYTVRVAPPPGASLSGAAETGVVVGGDRELVVTLPGSVGGDVPMFILGVSFPNPFSDIATIPFMLGEASPVKIGIYNAAGQLVRHLVRGPRAADSHQVTWNGRDGSGTPVAQGVYFVDMETSFGRQARKIVLVR